jgi:hypothetical protein
MKSIKPTVQIKLDDITIATLKGILHQVEQQKAKRVRKNTTADSQRQLKLLDDQNEEGQN